MPLKFSRVREMATEAGFELCGVAGAGHVRDFGRYMDWVDRGNAGAMGYLTDRRAALREDVRRLLPEARSVVCVGKLYNGPEPYSTEFSDPERGWIARYAWGDDYHDVMRAGLERLARAMEREAGALEWKVCVDTAPVLERTLAREAGLGWIGKNTCLINEWRGSWFFLGELIVDVDFAGESDRAAERCGTCTRCIEACPTDAIVPVAVGGYEIDSRLCISYLTIELKGAMEAGLRAGVGTHVFGCDICQDVCPWNRRAEVTNDGAFAARNFAPALERMAMLEEPEFREMFRGTPVERTRYRGFLRNVAVAMGNAGLGRFRGALEKLASSEDGVVAEHARWALGRLKS